MLGLGLERFGVMNALASPSRTGPGKAKSIILIFNGGAFAVFLALNMLTWMMMFVPFIGGFIGGLLGFVNFLVMLAYIVVAVKCMIDVNKGNPVKLPYISDLAEKFSRGI